MDRGKWHPSLARPVRHLAPAPAATLNFFAAYSSAARWLGRVSLCRGLSRCCCLGKAGGRARGGGKGAREADPGGEAGTRNLSPMIVIANIFTEVFGTVRPANPCMTLPPCTGCTRASIRVHVRLPHPRAHLLHPRA